MGRAFFLAAVMYLLIFFGESAATAVAHVHDDLLGTRQAVQTAGILAAAE